MIKFDNALLAELGLGRLPANLKRSTLAALYAVLEAQVGIRFADQMTNDQLAEFEDYFDRDEEKAAFDWLERNFPDYKAMVHEEYRRLIGELGRAAKWLVARTAP